MIKKREIKKIEKRNRLRPCVVEFQTLDEKITFVEKCFAEGVYFPSGRTLRSVGENWPLYPDLLLAQDSRELRLLNTVGRSNPSYQIVSEDKFIQIIKRG